MEEPRPPRPPRPPLLPVPGAGGRLPGGAAAGSGRLDSALPPVGGAEGGPALRPARRLTGVDLAATCLSVRSFPFFFFFGNCFPQLHKKSGFLPAGSPRGSGGNGSSPLRGEGARGARLPAEVAAEGRRELPTPAPQELTRLGLSPPRFPYPIARF